MRNPLRIVDEMRDMDRFFSDFFSSDLDAGWAQPLSDVYETESNVVAEIDMPGVDKKDIDVNVTEDQIEVKAETKSEMEDKQKGRHRIERSYSGFYRCFGLPQNVDADQAQAEYKNGVLRITVPKLKVEQEKRKRLEVK